MQRFTTTREAKEFLIGRIVEQAQRSGIALTDVERKILYLSETGWTLPDISAVNDVFARKYDQSVYEKKIAALVREIQKRTESKAMSSGILGPKLYECSVRKIIICS